MINALTCILLPAGGVNSCTVSIRPEVHAPLMSTGVIFRCPLPSSDTFAAELVSVSISPLAQWAWHAVPWYWSPVS